MFIRKICSLGHTPIVVCQWIKKHTHTNTFRSLQVFANKKKYTIHIWDPWSCTFTFITRFKNLCWTARCSGWCTMTTPCSFRHVTRSESPIQKTLTSCAHSWPDIETRFNPILSARTTSKLTLTRTLSGALTTSKRTPATPRTTRPTGTACTVRALESNPWAQASTT